MYVTSLVTKKRIKQELTVNWQHVVLKILSIVSLNYFLKYVIKYRAIDWYLVSEKQL